MPSTLQQPEPTPAGGDHIHDLVVANLLSSPRPWGQQIARDVAARKQLGIERYGVPLQANNGRDALVDAYQEALDLAVYFEQALVEGRVTAASVATVRYLRNVMVEPARVLRDLLNRQEARNAAV